MRAPLLALLLAVAAACSGAPRTPPEYPGVLAAPAALGADFLARQQVVATYRGRDASFQAVLQKRGDELTLIGLTPFGTRAFLLQQRGAATTFTSYTDRALPFPPRYILLDIHRVLFMGLGGAPRPDGEHTATRHGEVVTERWAGGRLHERRFRRASGAPAGAIVVRYEGGMEGDVPPRRVTLDNGWFGYALTITTLSHQRL